MNTKQAIARWPGRPSPLVDETFSSWFFRVASANGLSPVELCRAAVPGSHMHGQDLDRHVDPDLLIILAASTGVAQERLLDATVSRWVGRVFDHDDGCGKLPWLPPVGTEKLSHFFGQQYCPRCLAEDAIPYFRLHWRLSFVTVCETHGNFLLDRCPRCAEPIHPLKIGRKGRHIICGKCRAELIDAIPRQARYNMIQNQRYLRQVVEDSWADLPGYGPLYSLSFFWLASVLLHLLAGGKFARPLRDRLAQDQDSQRELALIPLVRDADRLPPERRAQLLALVLDLLDDWPHHFIEAARSVKATKCDLVKYAWRVPFAFWEPVMSELSAPWRKLDEPELRQGIDYLKRHGVVPTYDALTDLFETKFVAHKDLAEPAFDHEPYGKGRYWKLDGIDPQLRRAARVAAHGEGENVAAWVERVLRAAIQQKDAAILPK